MNIYASDSPRPAKAPRRDIARSLLFTFLRDDLTKGEYDVEIEVESERFEAHASVLSSASPILKVMLTNGMREFVSRKVTLPNIKKSVWKLVMDFMYTSHIKLDNEESCVDVIHFAHQYEMNLLLRVAEIELNKYTTEENAIERLLFAEKLGLKEVSKESSKAIAKNFMRIHETEKFRRLSFSIVDQILKRQDLIIFSELDVVQAIIGWTDGLQRFDLWKTVEARHLFHNVNIGIMKPWDRAW